jgi:protein-arginine kinase activator protein McsA
VGQHRSASASRLLGLDGFEVITAEVVAGEWQLEVQTTATVVGCQGCGVRAEFTAAARSGCATCRSAAARLCWPGASACGAVGSRPVGSGPGPSRRPRSGLGRC